MIPDWLEPFLFIAPFLAFIGALWWDFRKGVRRPEAQHDERPVLERQARALADLVRLERPELAPDTLDRRIARWTPERGAEVLCPDGRWRSRGAMLELDGLENVVRDTARLTLVR